MKTSRLLLLILAAVLCTAYSSVKVNRSYCVHSSGELCRIPFDYLLFKNDLIKSHRLLGFSGYLKREGDDYYLYRNADDSKYRARTFAILLRNSQQYREDLQYLDLRVVTVLGTLAPSNGDHWAQLTLSKAPQENALTP